MQTRVEAFRRLLLVGESSNGEHARIVLDGLEAKSLVNIALKTQLSLNSSQLVSTRLNPPIS